MDSFIHSYMQSRNYVYVGVILVKHLRLYACFWGLESDSMIRTSMSIFVLVPY